MSQTPVADMMRAKLLAAFSPSELELLDESAQHAGHSGHNPLGESHFRLTIKAAVFEGKSRVQRQQMVYAVLAEEMRGRVHALAMTVSGCDGV